MDEVRTAAAEMVCFSAESVGAFIAGHDVNEKSRASYAAGLKHFMLWLDDQGIRTPERADVMRWRDWAQTQYKAATVRLYLIAIKLYFEHLSKAGLYPDITSGVKNVKVSAAHKDDYLTASAAREVIECIDRTSTKGVRDYAIIGLMIACGLRTVEVTRCNVNDFTTRGGKPVLWLRGKGQHDHGMFTSLPAEVDKAIRTYLQTRGTLNASDPLFASISRNNAGGRLTTRSISAIAKTAMVNAGYDSDRLSAHSLRHTCAMCALTEGASVREVQQKLRHSSIDTTMIYLKELDYENNTCSERISAVIFGE